MLYIIIMRCYFCGHEPIKHTYNKPVPLRWRYTYKCVFCNKIFNYKYLIIHKKLYKNVLWVILNYRSFKCLIDLNLLKNN